MCYALLKAVVLNKVEGLKLRKCMFAAKVVVCQDVAAADWKFAQEVAVGMCGVGPTHFAEVTVGF